MAATEGAASQTIAQEIGAHASKLVDWFKDYLKAVGLLVSAVTTLIGLVLVLKDKAHLGGPALAWFALFAGLPLVAAFASDVLPRWRTLLRERRVLSRPDQGVANYFRIGPREDTPEDRKQYDRADRRHVDVLNWLKSTDEPIVFLTGKSGTGKSSLLASYVLPELRESTPAVRSLVLRSYDDPVIALREALLDADILDPDAPKPGPTTKARTLLDRACDRLSRANERLLIVFDQFEELVILHGQAPERVEAMKDLLDSLRRKPIAGLTVLLAIRTDYIGILHKLGLPALDEKTNWRDVPAFTEPDAIAFLRGGFQQIGAGRLDAILSELRTLEETRGLIRPIVLNMAGVILSRESGPQGLASKPGAVLSGYVRACVEQGDVRDYAAKILAPMLTDAGTKRPRSVGELAAETKLDPGVVEGYLTQMAPPGLVRRITRPDAIADRIWEVSHDFVARLLDPILHHPRPSFWRRVRPWLTPSALTLWMVVIFWALPYERNRQVVIAMNEAINSLGSTGCSVQPRTDEAGRVIEYRIRYGGSSPLSSITPHLKVLERSGPLEFMIFDAHVRDLAPLRGLTALRSLDLTGTGVRDLAPLRGLTALRSLDLSYCTNVSDLAPLRNLKALQWLDLSACTNISDIGPLEGLTNLLNLDLHEASVRDLAPLRDLTSLQYLNLQKTGVSDLAPLGHLKAIQELWLCRTGVSDLAPLRGLTELQILDLRATKVDGEQISNFRKEYPLLTILGP